MSAFSTWLAELMNLRGDSQRKIAAYTGLSNSTVHNWLSSKNRPDYESCVKLAEYLHLPEADVLEKAGYSPSSVQPTVDILDPDLKLLFNAVQDLDEEGIEELKGFIRYVWQRKAGREVKKKKKPTE